jgi:ElaB/YqjD/DUF883 family membrane-anchored ribosome-binding protein
MKTIALIPGKSLPRVGTAVRGFLDRGATVVRKGTSGARDMASRTVDRAVAYTHKRPGQSLFIAAGAGALAVLLAGMALRRRH